MATQIKATAAHLSDLKPGDVYVSFDAPIREWLNQRQHSIPAMVYLGYTGAISTAQLNARKHEGNPVVLKITVWEEGDAETIRRLDGRQSIDVDGPATISRTYMQP